MKPTLQVTTKQKPTLVVTPIKKPTLQVSPNKVMNPRFIDPSSVANKKQTIASKMA